MRKRGMNGKKGKVKICLKTGQPQERGAGLTKVIPLPSLHNHANGSTPPHQPVHSRGQITHLQAQPLRAAALYLDAYGAIRGRWRGGLGDEGTVCPEQGGLVGAYIHPATDDAGLAVQVCAAEQDDGLFSAFFKKSIFAQTAALSLPQAVFFKHIRYGL